MRLLCAAVAATGFLVSGAPLKSGFACARTEWEIYEHSKVYCDTLDTLDCPGKGMEACTVEEAIIGYRLYQVPSTD